MRENRGRHGSSHLCSSRLCSNSSAASVPYPALHDLNLNLTLTRSETRELGRERRFSRSCSTLSLLVQPSSSILAGRAFCKLPTQTAEPVPQIIHVEFEGFKLSREVRNLFSKLRNVR